MNFHFSKFLSYENAHDCYPKPSVSAVLFGFHGINLFKNLVSRELLRILENFHFSISISKHFDFTFHFSKKSESILISLCTSRKKVKTIFFSLCTSRKRVKAFYFHFSLLELQKPTLAGPCVAEVATPSKMMKRGVYLPYWPKTKEQKLTSEGQKCPQ